MLKNISTLGKAIAKD